MNKVDLINSLIEKLEEVPHLNYSKVVSFKNNARMILSQVFGPKSEYIEKISNIRFSFSGSPATNPQTIRVRKKQTWTNGMNESRSLFETMLQHLEISDEKGESDYVPLVDVDLDNFVVPSSNPKKSWNNWEEVEPLGESGQKQAFKVIDKSGEHKGQYVLKVEKDKANHQAKKRFSIEVEARSKLHHSNIPAIVDFNNSKFPSYFVEEYVNGGDLEKVRADICNSPVKTLKYFLQVCETVEYAHKQEIIHRDLKPGNILYDKKADCLKVTDFGICFDLKTEEGDRLTIARERVGPRDFICPEMEEAKLIKPTKACDIYGLGKLLYWMLSGKELYREEFSEIESDLVLLLDDKQMARVNKLLEKMLIRKPELRVQSLDIITQELRTILPLVEKDFNLLDLNVPQKCIYCGIGNYDLVGDYDDRRDPGDDDYLKNSNNLFRIFGPEINKKQKQYVFQCEHCGNIQFFMRGFQRKVWIKKKQSTEE